MIIRFRAPAALARMVPRAARPGFHGKRPEDLVMKWETPQAIDLRFGMEITMYIAHR